MATSLLCRISRDVGQPRRQSNGFALGRQTAETIRSLTEKAIKLCRWEFDCIWRARLTAPYQAGMTDGGAPVTNAVTPAANGGSPCADGAGRAALPGQDCG